MDNLWQKLFGATVPKERIFKLEKLKKEKILFLLDTDDANEIAKFKQNLNEALKNDEKYIILGGGIQICHL